MKLSAAVLALAFVSQQHRAAVVRAFPNGAGSCAEGPDKFLPGSQHDGKGGGSIADGGLAVYFGTLNLDTDVGADVPPGGQAFTPVGLCTGNLNLATGFNLCQRCQGDCDDDTECAPGFVCFQRSTDEIVPGCYGLAVTDRDYCHDANYVPVDGGPVPSPTTASVPEPAPVTAPVALPTLPAMGALDVVGDCDGDDGDFCGLCIGDCDDDGDCEDGLFCFQRDDDEDVPGCQGDMGEDAGVDFCVPEFYRGNRQLRTSTTNNQQQQPKQQPEIRKLQKNSDVLEFQTTRTYTIRIDGMGRSFRGFLFRVSGDRGQDLTGALETEFVATQIMASDGERIGIPNVSPGSCAIGVSGATHVNNLDKQVAEVLITVPSNAAGQINLEVTAMINKDLWYLSEYTLMAKDAADMEIPDQVPVTPVAAPVAAPTFEEPATTDAPTAADSEFDSEELPEGAVRFPATGDNREVEFGEVGTCTGPGGTCEQCQGDCDNDAECAPGLVCYQRRANEEVPFCYGVAMVDRDYCSLLTGTSPAASVGGTASVMAATIVAIGVAIMFA